MIEGIRVKICGLTSLVDAGLADAVGADYLGFNLYPASPRHLALPAFRAMAPQLPGRKKVAVMVEPSAAELARALEAEFDFFQVHFSPGLPVESVAAWSAAVGADRLWLAPKLAAGQAVGPEWLALAETFLLDASDPGGRFGGTGRTGDWPGFRRHREAHPDKQWILAGGLSAENIGAALAATGARWVDLASGVESAPGVKDSARLQAFAERLREAARTG